MPHSEIESPEVDTAFLPHHSLHHAALTGDHDLIRKLVNQGADLNEFCVIYPNRNLRVTPLSAAAGSDRGASVDTMRLLVELGASPFLEEESRSPAFYACDGITSGFSSGGDACRLRYALELGCLLPETAKERNRLLCHTARKGDPERVRILLSEGFLGRGYG